MNTNQDSDIIVSIQCLVYNHEPYLRQCLDGFVMQKTNFRFEAIVHDDASTDNSAKIIEEYADKYPDIIKPVLEKENQYSKRDGSLERIINNACNGKYIAFCEGDDYWIDPNKLQRQVDFLESNLDYGLVHTNFSVLTANHKIVHNGANRYKDKIKDGYVFESLFNGCWIRTLTVCFRKELINSLPKLPNNAFTGDLFLFYEISRKSKCHFDNYESGVYRVLKNSASHTNSLTQYYNRSIRYRHLDYYYATHYPISSKTQYSLNKKWFIWDIKYYIKSCQFNEFKKLINNNYIKFRHGEYLFYVIFFLCQNKLIFNIISRLTMIKSSLQYRLCFVW